MGHVRVDWPAKHSCIILAGRGELANCYLTGIKVWILAVRWEGVIYCPGFGVCQN